MPRTCRHRRWYRQQSEQPADQLRIGRSVSARAAGDPIWTSRYVDPTAGAPNFGSLDEGLAIRERGKRRPGLARFAPHAAFSPLHPPAADLLRDGVPPPLSSPGWI